MCPIANSLSFVDGSSHLRVRESYTIPGPSLPPSITKPRALVNKTSVGHALLGSPGTLHCGDSRSSRAFHRSCTSLTHRTSGCTVPGSKAAVDFPLTSRLGSRAAAAHATTAALCPAEQCCPGRAAPPSPSCPPATTAAAAARATSAAGGGAAGSIGGAAGAGGAGPTTDHHCLSWPLSWQLKRPGVDSSGHCLSRTTPPLGSFRCVPGRVEAAALGSSESVVAPGAGESAAALGARESADALGASASIATVTPLAAPVPVSLADPTGGGSQVAASSRVSASGQLAASCSCRVLSHHTLLWHHHLGHPSLPRLRSMHSRLLVSGLPRSLPSLPLLPAPPCLPYVERRQRTAPHSSEIPSTTALV
ncbi:unnamed protein product [Closterium sp. NIES-53]